MYREEQDDTTIYKVVLMKLIDPLHPLNPLTRSILAKQQRFYQQGANEPVACAIAPILAP